MRSYAAKKGEKIIIAADNDGKESRTDGAINMAKEAFKDRGAIVEIVRPTGAEKRDFNDMLQRGEEKELSALIRTPIEKHEARSLRDYFGAGKDGTEKDEALAKALPINGELQLTRLRQYNILEETIVESFRVSELRGKSQLHHMWKIVGFAEYTYAENKEMFEIAANVGARIDKPEAVASLMIDQERFDEKAARMKAADIVLAKIKEKKQKTEDQFNLYTRKYIKSRLDQFNRSKKEAKDSDQLFEEIKAEQSFLSSLDNDKLTLLDVSVIAKALALRDPQTKETMVSIEKSLLAHKKQGLGQNEELMKLILSKESNLEDLASAISKEAERNRSSYLMPIHIEQAELEKLGCKLDKDELVGKFKHMSYEEQCKWGNDRLAEETRKYVTPLLARHQEAKDKAPNFREFMKAIEDEHKTLSRLGEHHQLALSALDKKNGGGLKLSISASYAKKLDIGLVKESIDYALKHELTKPELIRSELSKPGENLTNIYIKLRAECTFHKNNIIEKQSQQQVRKEQAKQPIKQLEKDFDGPCL